AEDHCSEGKGTKYLSDPLQPQPLGKGRGEFEKFSDHIEEKVPGHEEEYGINPEFIADERIYNVPPAAQIKEDRTGIKDIGEEPIEDGSPYDWMIFFRSEDIDDKGKDIGAPGKGYPYHDVKTYPYTPWEAGGLGHNRTQSVDETIYDQDYPEGQYGGGDYIEGCKDLTSRL